MVIALFWVAFSTLLFLWLFGIVISWGMLFLILLMEAAVVVLFRLAVGPRRSDWN